MLNKKLEYLTSMRLGENDPGGGVLVSLASDLT